MKEKKNVLKLILGTAISIVMLFCFALQVPVYAAEPEEEKEFYLEEIIDLGTVETSAVSLGMFSLRDGNVDLIDGTAVEWIERLDLSGEEQVIRGFYDSLVEGSDNDGTDDYLIADSYYANEPSYVAVATVDSEVTYATEAEADAAVSAELSKYAKYIRAAVDAFDRDHPEVFWLSGTTQAGCSYSISGSDGSGYTYSIRILFYLKTDDFDIRATDYRSENEIKATIAAVDTKVEELTDAVKDKPVVDKIKYFNDWLTKNNQYNTSDNLNAIDHDCRACTGALFAKTGTEGPVCEAYARAFKVLCDAVDIPCILVDGTAVTNSGSGAHMWNYVQVGSNWYGVDVTWNDPTVENSSGAVSGAEREDYLLVGSDTVISERKFIVSHPVENRVSGNGVSFTNGPVLAASVFAGCTEHSGGEATCAVQAVCGICGESYGELVSHTLDGNGFCTECDGYEAARQVSSEHHPELNATHNGYYAIENAGQLYWFMEYVNDGNTAINAVLTADIVVNESLDNNPREWLPIGYCYYGEFNIDILYAGIFDGNNKTISGLYCDVREEYLSGVGLIGQISSGAVIKNVGVVDSYIKGFTNVGGVCGFNYSGTVINCYNTGEVSGDSFVGGVCGSIYEGGTIINCYNTGEVSGESTNTVYAGGVCGSIEGGGTIINCYNTGGVHGESTNTVYAGGVCGSIYEGGTIINCYYLDTIATGGIGEEESNGRAEAKTATQFASGEVAYLLNGTVTDGVWSAGATDGTQSWYQTLSGNSADAYPVFDSEHGTVYKNLACDGTSPVYRNVNENDSRTDGNSDGYCDNCGTIINGIGVNLAGHSVSLGGQIGMNFYMDLDASVLADDTAYMLFTLPDNSTQKVNVADVKTSPVTINEKEYYVFTCKVDAREMADTVTAKMICEGGSKEGASYTYSVKDYANALINKNDATDKEKALAKEMLNYGAYAQTYFGYNTNNLANNGLVDGVANGFVQADKAALTACKPVVTDNSDIFDYAGSTLILEADIKVRHYFKLTNETAIGNLDGLTMYTAQQGNPVEGTYYYFESNGIAAVDLGTMAEYTGVSGITVRYCPLSYVTTVLANESQELKNDAALQNLMKALYLYYQAVVNYNTV